MYCIKCGTKNEDDSKFCINCGEKLEEIEQPKEEPKEQVEEVKEEIKQNEELNTVETPTSKGINPLLIIIPIVAVIFIIAVSLLAYNVYNELTEDNSQKQTSNNNSAVKIEDNKKWEVTYTIPKEFKEEEYNSDTLKFFKYKDKESFCSFSAMKVTYIESDETEDVLMKKLSNLDKEVLEKAELKEKDINGTKYKYYEMKSEWYNKYEYGILNSNKTAFYSIHYTDYSPENKFCEKKLKEILKSMKYKEQKNK